MFFVEVIISQKMYECFVWHVPRFMQSTIQVGSLVLVDLSGKKTTGIVRCISTHKPDYKTKPLLQVYHYEQYAISAEQLRLWEWVATYYLSSLGEVMVYAYPSFLFPVNQSYRSTKSLIEDDLLHSLSYEEEVIMRYLITNRPKAINSAQLLKWTRFKTIDDILQRLIEKELCVKVAHRIQKINVKSHKHPEEATYKLTIAQQKACNQISDFHNAGKEVVLLYGITGSGKTNIYIDKIKQALQNNEQVLFLIPEIILSEQLIKRLIHFLGDSVILYHSRVIPSRRKSVCERLRGKEPMVVVGTMSAIFLPFRELSLVICDEEHDSSFKQQSPPFYNARDTSIMLAYINKAKVILGSATPSIESYYNASSGKYGYVELVERYSGTPLPEIKIFDLNTYLSKVKMELWIGPPVKKAMDETLSSKNQMLIFHNRRGYAPYTICNFCGHIASCSNCSSHLIYHKSKQIFICHYCNTTYSIHHCMSCYQQGTLLLKKAGTQRVDEVIKQMYPKENIYVVDGDTGKNNKQIKKIIEDYGQQKYSILLGTQMIAKGFDFDFLQLVIIPDFDSLLQFHQFRNNERVMQQIEQVGGRAGRKNKQGCIWIQTKNPQHPLFEFIHTHNYLGFLKREIEIRRRFSYPPFRRIIYVFCIGRNQEKVEYAACELVHRLHTHNMYIELQGPLEPSISKIRNHHIRQVTLKCSKTYEDYLNEKLFIKRMVDNSRYAGVVMTINVDPI